MTDKQLRELATLQAVYYDQVVARDTSAQHEKLVLIAYWIRKQIWEEARMIIVQVKVDDFAKFGIDQVQLSREVTQRFGDFQASMLKALAAQADDGKLLYQNYLDWVSDVIEANVQAHTNKYIKIMARRIKGN